MRTLTERSCLRDDYEYGLEVIISSMSNRIAFFFPKLKIPLTTAHESPVTLDGGSKGGTRGGRGALGLRENKH